MPLPRPSSPRALWADLRAFARQRSRHQWIAAFFALVMPIIIVVGFYYDAQTNILPGEQIVYVENWPANRTDEQIIAQQRIDQAKREEAQKARQEQFKRLEERLGI